MFNHTKVYTKHFNLGVNEHHYCEVCGLRSDGGIHHIDGRGEGKDVIENLMGICARHHHMAEMSKECNEIARKCHVIFLKVNPYLTPEMWKDSIFKNNRELMEEAYRNYINKK